MSIELVVTSTYRMNPIACILNTISTMKNSTTTDSMKSRNPLAAALIERVVCKRKIVMSNTTTPMMIKVKLIPSKYAATLSLCWSLSFSCAILYLRLCTFTNFTIPACSVGRLVLETRGRIVLAGEVSCIFFGVASIRTQNDPISNCMQ
jgi:hypothetical protein